MKSLWVYISKIILFLYGLLFISSLISVNSYASNSPLYKSMNFRINGAPVGSVIEFYLIDDDDKNNQVRILSLNVREDYQSLREVGVPSLYDGFDGGSISIEGSASTGFYVSFHEVSIYRQTPWLRITGTVLKGYDVSSALEIGEANSVIEGRNKSLAEPNYEGSIPVNENGELNKYVGLTFNGAEINYICSPHKYRVIYDSNGAGESKEQQVTYGENFNLQANSFIRDGFNFLGWSRERNSKNNIYREGECLKNLDENNGAVVYFYAVWEKKDWDVFLINSSQNNGILVSKEAAAISDSYFKKDYLNRSFILKNKDMGKDTYKGEYSVTKYGVTKN